MTETGYDEYTNSEDVNTWLPLDGLAPGFDANRAPHSTALDGRDLTVVLDGGGRVRYAFDADRLGRKVLDDPGDEHTAVPYEAFEIDAGLYFVQLHLGYRAISLVLDTARGRVVRVTASIGAVTRRPTVVEQRFDVGVIEGTEQTGEAPAPSRDLLGRRVLWSYSEAHRYEHIYLTERWYTFHCVAGPERGLADTDACTYYRIRPGIYLFAWREKVVPCGAVTVADHRDLRSHGALFGLHADGETPVHFAFGAHGRLLSQTVYPE